MDLVFCQRYYSVLQHRNIRELILLGVHAVEAIPEIGDFMSKPNLANPFEAPTPSDGSSASLELGPASPSPSPKLMIFSVATVFGSAAIGGRAGAVIGGALGTWAPSYYRLVFSNGDTPQFESVAVGLGQGLTQGIVFGTMVGLALIAMFL